MEVFFGADWWEAVIIQLQDDRIMIHYVGGDENEDEWILKSSDRLRPTQSARVPEISSLLKNKHPELDARELDSHQQMNEAGKQRPIRRSRVLSNDSRLAMQLQEQEVKAAASARRKILHKEKKSQIQSRQASMNSIEGQTLAYPIPSVCDSSASRQGSETKYCVPESHSHLSTRKKSNASPNTASGARCVSLNKKRKPAQEAAASEDKSGMVSFYILPDESSSCPVPPLKQSRLCLPEDSPVFHVKRLIMDEALPEKCAEQIVIRTAAGMHVGQDHSLRYVRTILWPRSKGDLILKYSICKGLLL